MKTTLIIYNLSQVIKKTKLLLMLSIFLITCHLNAQEVKDIRLVGMVAFSANTFQDSIASKNIYTAVSRVLVQTKRFTVLEIDKWKLTQAEMERQKDGAFLERPIIKKGKSLGAQVIILGIVKNAEIYQDAGKYAARVDYELKYVDVETGKSIAAETFTGDSETAADKGTKISKGVEKIIGPAVSREGKWKAITLTGSAISAMSDAEKQAIRGKTIDAIEASVAHVNAWIRNTFGFSLLYLKMLEQDKHKEAQSILIEGGDDISMKPGYKLKMVLVTELETSRGKIRDEEPIAELEVDEVRAQTSKCKVIKGGKRLAEEAQNKNALIIFE